MPIHGLGVESLAKNKVSIKSFAIYFFVNAFSIPCWEGTKYPNKFVALNILVPRFGLMEISLVFQFAGKYFVDYFQHGANHYPTTDAVVGKN